MAKKIVRQGNIVAGNPVARPGGTLKPIKPGKPVPPMVMNPDSALLAKLPITQAHLKTIKKHYGI